MMHIAARSLSKAALSAIALALIALPASAQGRAAPPPAPQVDSVPLLRRAQTPPPPRPSSIPARQRQPTPPGPILPTTKPTAAAIDSQVVSASVAASPAVVPPALVRQVPPAPASRVVPSAAARSVSVSPPPANATGRCKDGTYLTGAATDQACASHNGLAVAFPAARQAPAAAVRRQ